MPPDPSVLERRAGPELVLFVHGLGCAKESFAGAWRARELSAYGLLAPDLPGHGGTPLGANRCRMEDLAAFLKELLEARRFERLHLVGHSMGGAVVLLLAEDGTPASLVNVEGNLSEEDCGLLSRRAAKVSLGDFKNWILPKMLDSAGQIEDQGFRLWAGWAANCDPAAFHRCSASLVAWSDSGRLLEIFRRLAVAKAYIHGGDSVIPAMQERLEGIDTIAVPGAGHFVMTDREDLFYPLLAERLAGKG